MRPLSVLMILLISCVLAPQLSAQTLIHPLPSVLQPVGVPQPVPISTVTVACPCVHCQAVLIQQCPPLVTFAQPVVLNRVKSRAEFRRAFWRVAREEMGPLERLALRTKLVLNPRSLDQAYTRYTTQAAAQADLIDLLNWIRDNWDFIKMIIDLFTNNQQVVYWRLR